MKKLVRRGVCLGLLAGLVAVPASIPALAQDGAPANITHQQSVLTQLTETGELDSSRVFTQLKVAGDGPVEVVLPDQSTRGLRNLGGLGRPNTDGDSVIYGLDATPAGVSERTVANHTADLPVSIDVEYQLDGQTLENARDLVGRTGELMVTYKLRNETVEEQELEIYNAQQDSVTETIEVGVPIVGILSLPLDGRFANVRADRANLVGDGRGNTIVNWSLVLFEPLGSFEQEVSWTAQVTDAIVPAANAQLAPVSSDSFQSLPDAQSAYADTFAGLQTITSGAVRIDMTMIAILDGAGQLLDGMSQLADGSGELANGLVQAADGSRDLADGTGQAASGSLDLAAGTGQAAAGSRDLAAGTGQAAGGSRDLADGTGQALAGSRQLADGTSQAAAGSRDLADGTGQASAGSRALATGVGQLRDGAGQLAGGTGALSEGAAALAAGMGLLEDGTGALAAGAEALADGAEEVDDNAKVLAAGGAEIAEGLHGVIAGVLQLKDGLDGGVDGLLGGVTLLRNGVGDLIDGIGADDQPGTVLGGLFGVRHGMETTVRQGLGGAIGFLETGLPATGGASVKNQLEAAAAAMDPADPGFTEVTTALTLLGEVDDFDPEATPTTALAIIAGLYGAFTPVSEALGGAGLDPDSCADARTLFGMLGAAGSPLPLTMRVISCGIEEDLLGGAYLLAGGLDNPASEDSGAPTYNPMCLSPGDEGHEPTMAPCGLKQGLELLQASVLAGIGSTDDAATASILGGLAALSEGSDALAEGAALLQELGTAAVATGASDLRAGASQVAAGTGDAAAGSRELSGGATQIDEGAGALAAGAGEAAAGASDLSDGLAQIDTGANQLSGGLGEIDDGANQLVDGYAQIDTGAQQLSDGLAQIDTGANQLSGGLGEIDDGANQLSDGLGQIDDGANQLADGLGDARDGSGQLAEGMGDAYEGGQSLVGAMDELQEFGTNKILNDVSRAGLEPDRLLKQARAADERAKAGDGLPYGTADGANASAIYQFEIAGVGSDEGLSTPVRAGAAVLAFGAVGALGLGVRRFLI